MTGLDLPWNHRHPEPWDDPGPDAPLVVIVCGRHEGRAAIVTETGRCEGERTEVNLTDAYTGEWLGFYPLDHTRPFVRPDDDQLSVPFDATEGTR